MKFIKTLVYILLTLLLLYILACFAGPKKNHVERSVTINAARSVVFDQVKSLKAQDAWSPWNKYDPNMKKSFEGQDGAIGSKTSWEGNDSVGTGNQTITAIVPNESVDQDLQFLKPWKSEAKVNFKLADEGTGTKVTWTMDSDNPFMSRAMMLFMNIDKMVGADFERGLGNLKTLAETATPSGATPNYKIVESMNPGMTFVGGAKANVSFQDMKPVFEKGIESAMNAVMAAKAEMTGGPSGLYWTFDEKTMKSDMAIAIPVKAGTAVKGLTTHTIPAGKCLSVDYYGPFEGSAAAHYAIDAYIKEKGLTYIPPVIEEYITDPAAEPDTTKWLTKIHYFVK